MVIGQSLSSAFTFSFDGSTKAAATITAPSHDDNYIEKALYALVKGELYVFGGNGWANEQRVIKLYDFQIIVLRLRNSKAVNG